VKRYLLDTNVVTELRKPKPHGAVTAWLGARSDDEIFVSAVTIGELQAGVESLRERDSGKAAEIEAWVDQLASTAQVLPMDTACFREWARLMSHRSDELVEDAMIAATARVHGLTLATRNHKDFAHLDVAMVNPFSTGR
jgi:predicted nucleic acid-binding protein